MLCCYAKDSLSVSVGSELSQCFLQAGLSAQETHGTMLLCVCMFLTFIAVGKNLLL